MTEILQWMSDHPVFMSGMGLLSLFIFLIGLALVPRLVALIPEYYFVPSSRPDTRFRRQHPLLRATILFVKNLTGLTLISAGIMMLVLPGPGLLTLFVGFLLIDYPGKFWLERRLISIPPVLRALNWQREKSGKQPLRVE